MAGGRLREGRGPGMPGPYRCITIRSIITMDKRNKTALAYLLVGVAAAGRALLAVPENAAIQEVSLTVLPLWAICCWPPKPGCLPCSARRGLCWS